MRFLVDVSLFLKTAITFSLYSARMHFFPGRDQYYLSRPMGKPTICIEENKDADQLRGNREADQRLCFRYSDSTFPLLLKSEISSF